jgi:hypothetical protein
MEGPRAAGFASVRVGRGSACFARCGSAARRARRWVGRGSACFARCGSAARRARRWVRPRSVGGPGAGELRGLTLPGARWSPDLCHRPEGAGSRGSVAFLACCVWSLNGCALSSASRRHFCLRPVEYGTRTTAHLGSIAPRLLGRRTARLALALPSLAYARSPGIRTTAHRPRAHCSLALWPARPGARVRDSG